MGVFFLSSCYENMSQGSNFRIIVRLKLERGTDLLRPFLTLHVMEPPIVKGREERFHHMGGKERENVWRPFLSISCRQTLVSLSPIFFAITEQIRELGEENGDISPSSFPSLTFSPSMRLTKRRKWLAAKKGEDMGWKRRGK